MNEQNVSKSTARIQTKLKLIEVVDNLCGKV